MTNSEIIMNVVQYIESIISKKGISHRGLSNLCHSKGEPVSQNTISRMFKTPSSTTISTLLKVCDALDLNLSAIFRSIEAAKTSDSTNDSRLVYNINEHPYTGYTGKYHVFFLNTDHDSQEKLVHGNLEFGDFYATGECYARLDIDSGDFTQSGEPFTKHYEGVLVYSTNAQMFCQLVSNKYGDMWFLVFNHGNLNNKSLACVLGCAATASSGRIRHPAMHRFCLCNKEQYPELDKPTQNSLRNLLRIHNNLIFVLEERITELLKDETIDSTFRRNLTNHLNIAPKYYGLSKNVLKDSVDPSAYANAISKVLGMSVNERCFRIMPDDDTELKNLLHHSTKKEDI